jgi:superkiller protein 3
MKHPFRRIPDGLRIRQLAACTATLGLCGLLATAPSGCAATQTEEPISIRGSEPTAEQAARIAEADVARGAGRYDRALLIFQEILAENPTITTAYLGVGDIYMLKKEYERAEPAYGRAARLEPRNFDAQYGHGLALQMLRRFVDAVRAYHRALTIDPDSDKANLNLATTYFEMSQPEQAVIFAEKAIRLNPDNGAAYANLGAVYEELDRPRDAVDAYIAAIERMGNHPPLMMNLINVQARIKRYHEAAITAESLIRIEPSARAYERLGWCSFTLRDYDRSIAAYRSAVEIDPSHWPALNGIGVNALNTWLLSKKRDGAARLEARNAFRQSLRVNPRQDRVVELLLNYNL